MAKIRIRGGGFDEELYLDAGSFTNRELHLIKKETGVRAGELEEAFQAGDSDLLVALAYIALQRAGRDVPIDVLWELEAGAIDPDLSEEEADADPPQSRPDSDASVSGPTEAS